MEAGAEEGILEPKYRRSGGRASSPRTAAGSGSNLASLLQQTPMPGFNLPPDTPAAAVQLQLVQSNVCYEA